MTGNMWRAVLVEPAQFAVEEIPIPKPGSGEVLIRVGCVGVCGSDISALHDKHPYIHRPIVLGHEVSGVIAEVGEGTSISPGTRVTVIPHLICDTCEACTSGVYNHCVNLKCIGAQADGAHAEYIVISEKMVIPIDDNVSLVDAALVEPAAVGYHGMRYSGVGKGDRVLIMGAGPIGVFALQAAKALGAERVYISDIDSWRLELAQDLGADGVINISEQTLADGISQVAGGARNIDVMVDCVGGQGAILDQLISLARRGSRIVVIGMISHNYKLPLLPDLVEHELTMFGTTMYVPQDYRDVIAHMAAGRIRTDGMVTHKYALKDVPSAFEMIDKGKERFFKVVFEAGDAEAVR